MHGSLRIGEHVGFINKRGATLAQDNAAIHKNRIRISPMCDGDQLMHRIDTRHKLGGMGRTDHNIGALSGFQTANEMLKARSPRAADRHHFEDIFGDHGMSRAPSQLEREKTGITR